MRNVPRLIPKATPRATVILKPHCLIVPTDTSLALNATAMSDGSAIVVAEALKITNGKRSQAAKMLSISRPTLHAKMHKYNIKLKTEISD